MKVSISTIFISSLIAAAFFSACEERPVVIPEINNDCTNKVILIEELTGVSCPNCPRGTEAVNEILDLFPGKVIVYGVHGDFLSEPQSDSKYDFRSTVAKETEDFLKPWLGKPAASIDRFEFIDFTEGEIAIVNLNQWLSRVEDRCQTPQSVDIILTSDFDADTREASISVTAVGVLPVVGELRVNLVITESHLIDVQDGGVLGIIPDYEHNHIMKDRLSALSGDFLISDFSVDQSVTKTYTYTLPAEDNGEWLVENMEVIAFVTEGGQQRGPVLHAAQVPLD